MAVFHDQLVFAVSMVLRDRRESLSISQSDLARKSGLHRSYIGDLERGSRGMTPVMHQCRCHRLIQSLHHNRIANGDRLELAI